MNKKITIITPTYNRAHTLDRVYQSLIRQSFKDFLWLVMDDGSTDHTKDLIQKFKEERQIEIEYFHYQNSKKFYTVFKGVEKVKTSFFTVLDSDDAYTVCALEKMYKVANELDSTQFISATFNSCFPDGKLVGTKFPENFDGSILEMRYKFKVRGDKHSIFITEPYKKYLAEFNYSFYKNKYAPQKIFFSIYDGRGMKSRFVNESVRIYYQDLEDISSMSAERIKPCSYLGLKNGYLSVLNSYKYQLLKYPNALFKNLVGYQVFSFACKIKSIRIIGQMAKFKLLGIFILPFSYFYHKSRF